MSITFAAMDTNDVDTRVFAVTCEVDGNLGEFVGYANAYVEAQAHDLICTSDLCRGYGADVDEVFADGDPVPVNVANRNAIDLLSALGYPVDLDDPDMFGDEDAAAFLGRVEVALALAPADNGLVEVTWSTGGAVNIDCARRPGYLQGRLSDLRDLALACQRSGQRVMWG